MKLRTCELWLLVSLCLCAASAAQAPVQPVQWTGAVTPKTAVKPGTSIDIELSAEVQEGWHVYGLTQLPGGPTPLRVSVDANEAARGTGAATGTAPLKKHDTAFDLDTEVYERSFALHLPVQVDEHAAARRQTVPVSVRFQSCNDRVCLPPRTVHISVPIEISQNN